MNQRRSEQEQEIFQVQIHSEVGAGRVVPFTPRNQTAPVALPVGTDVQAQEIGLMTVRGPSLNNLGIYDGDYLICTRKFTKRDITPETVCIVFIGSTGELQAKKVIEQYGKITLRSSGGDIKDAFYERDDIEVKSIVIGYQRMRDEYGRFRKDGDEDIPF